MKVSFFFFLVLVSCTVGSKITLDHGILFHGNASKLWLVNKAMVGKKDFTKLRFIDKELMIFHENGNVFVYSVGKLAEPGEKLSFSLNGEKRLIEIQSKKNRMKYKILFTSRKKILLKSVNPKQPMVIELVNFPEY